MANSDKGCGKDMVADGLLPVSPFTALQFHFGMLLGVDDLEALDGYPRGKVRLHNAWLHRAGVVWGFPVEVVEDRGELKVCPGLALDGAGHELHLDECSCLNLGAWYEAHQDDFDPPLTPDAGGGVTFDAHVVARFRACLSRPVPAIAEPCEGATRDVAYSRAQETVELLLRPGLAPEPEAPYPRLRLLFGLRSAETGSAEDAAIVARREVILTHPAGEQPALFLQEFRELAALDVLELRPAAGAGGATTLFPKLDQDEVVLGNVTGIHLVQQGDTGWKLVPELPEVDVKVRPSHVATATIQELLNGPPCGCGAGGAGGEAGGGEIAPPHVADAGGPRFKPGPKLDKKSLVLEATAPLLKASVTVDAVAVTTFDEKSGWSTVDLKSVRPDAAGTHVKVELKEEIQGDWVRVVARGTGAQPILGMVRGVPVPLAGAEGPNEPPGTAMNGNDFIFQWKRS